MNNFISYKRIEKELNINEIQELFNDIIQNGSDIIYYKEERIRYKANQIKVVIITGKPRN